MLSTGPLAVNDILASTGSLRLASVLLGLMLASGCHGNPSSQSPQRPTPTAGFPSYDGTVEVDPVSRSIRASWRIGFVRTQQMTDSVTFLLNDSLKVSRVAGKDVRSHAQRTESGLKHVTVQLARSVANGGVTTIDIDYSGSPAFSSDSINGISSDWVELGLDSFWFPVFGDFAQSLVARVALRLPAGWRATASGAFSEAEGTLVLRNTVPLIDIAFAASPSLRQEDRERVSVYHTGESPVLVSNLLATTDSCSRHLNQRYGARRPLPPAKMVIAPRKGPGYARKNYIVVTRTADTATVALQRFVCHELAHFWSSGAISSGPENWLNEAFAEFVSARYVRATSGEQAYAKILAQWTDRARGQPAIWTPESKRRPMAGTSYGKAPHLLHRLEERVGSEVMDKILVRYMQESIATTPLLIALIGEVAGAETATWFRENLAA